MFNIDPSGKIKLTAKGYLSPPSSCLVCGNGNCEEGYLDLGTYIDYYGQAYMCWFCVVQAAETISCVIPEDAAKMEAMMQEVVESRDSLAKELETANERINAYSIILGPINLPVPVPGEFSSDSADPAQAELDFTELDSEGSTDGEPVTEEPVKDDIAFGPKRDERSDSSPAFGF